MSVAGTEAGAIRGWGCTPTGETTSAAVPSEEQSQATCLPPVLHRGWRRTALYCIILFLMIIVFINIGLTLWIISVLRLSVNGIGPIKIVRGGIQVASQTWIVGDMVTSSITSQPAQPIIMHSHRNFSVLVSEPNQPDHAKLLIKRDSIECGGHSFHVQDARGRSVFQASRDEVKVFADTFNVDGDGGLAIKGAVQTPLLKAPYGSDLLMESSTRSLDLRAPQSIHLESRAGSIDITSHSNITFRSEAGAIKIEALNIEISNLQEANTTARPQKGARNLKVYQLCACANGKLFLAAPDALCELYEDDKDLCR